MKAIVSKKAGPPQSLKLQEIKKPVPRNDEVLVKVYASSVTQGDVIMRGLRFPLTLVFNLFGAPRKEIPGHELAGVVEAVGRDVNRFQPGDEVFGTTSGLRVGANAHYVCVPEAGKKGVLALKPANMGFQESAVLPVGGMAALFLLRKAGVQQGQKVLVNGASGSVGSYGVQLARHFGARVTGVCSGRNVDLVRSLGAEEVIDYTKQDFSENGELYDVIFDAVGKISKEKSAGSLAPGGVFVTVQSTTSESLENLNFLKELAEAGEIRPVIDRCYALAETAEAHRYVETGRKTGNVVIVAESGASDELDAEDGGGKEL